MGTAEGWGAPVEDRREVDHHVMRCEVDLPLYRCHASRVARHDTTRAPDVCVFGWPPASRRRE
jgi:hypothetical protein